LYELGKEYEGKNPSQTGPRLAAIVSFLRAIKSLLGLVITKG
jgi:hypothetical protein